MIFGFMKYTEKYGVYENGYCGIDSDYLTKRLNKCKFYIIINKLNRNNTFKFQSKNKNIPSVT